MSNYNTCDNCGNQNDDCQSASIGDEIIVICVDCGTKTYDQPEEAW